MSRNTASEGRRISRRARRSPSPVVHDLVHSAALKKALNGAPLSEITVPQLRMLIRKHPVPTHLNGKWEDYTVYDPSLDGKKDHRCTFDSCSYSGKKQLVQRHIEGVHLKMKWASSSLPTCWIDTNILQAISLSLLRRGIPSGRFFVPDYDSGLSDLYCWILGNMCCHTYLEYTVSLFRCSILQHFWSTGNDTVSEYSRSGANMNATNASMMLLDATGITRKLTAMSPNRPREHPERGVNWLGIQTQHRYQYIHTQDPQISNNFTESPFALFLLFFFFSSSTGEYRSSICTKSFWIAYLFLSVHIILIYLPTYRDSVKVCTIQQSQLQCLISRSGTPFLTLPFKRRQGHVVPVVLKTLCEANTNIPEYTFLTEMISCCENLASLHSTRNISCKDIKIA